MSSESSNPKRTGLSFSIGLSLFYAFFFVAGYLGLFAAADFLIRNAIATNERELVAERLSEYRAWFVGGQIQNLRARFQEQSRRGEDLEFVHITGPVANALLFSSPRGSELLKPEQLRSLSSPDQGVVATLKTESPRNIWTVASSPLPVGQLIQAGRISTQAFEPADRFRHRALWSILPVSLLALFGGAALSYRAMKPVRDLAATVSDIVETGKLDQRVEVSGTRGDLAEMGILFNRMLDQNQGLIRAMRESLDNAAHDLRTPMARMRAVAESALVATDDPEAVREALGSSLEESDRVLKMLDTLMDVAEAETGVMQLNRESIDLPRMVRQVADLYDLVAEEEGISVHLELPDAAEISADRVRLQQAIANLVDNAVKYGNPGGNVWIRASSDQGDKVTIEVADDGIGIPSDEQPRIWNRLYRGDQSRSKRGLGLGLSFVKAIVDAHGGIVEVESDSGEGAKFRIVLPVAPSLVPAA